VTTPDANDLAAITASIKDAKEMADYVVVSIHSHEGAPGANSLQEPAQFVREFAHAAIDAGADVFVGHGNHALRGIEIYKGKTIFYSLGNFIFENDLVVPQPTEFYQQFGLGRMRFLRKLSTLAAITIARASRQTHFCGGRWLRTSYSATNVPQK
jgi:poly-gamma-glutamate synthesis protein (capsule biosynthesis protein)